MAWELSGGEEVTMGGVHEAGRGSQLRGPFVGLISMLFIFRAVGPVPVPA